jgi:hypothetical protein
MIYIYIRAALLPVLLPVAWPIARSVARPVMLPRCGLPLTLLLQESSAYQLLGTAVDRLYRRLSRYYRRRVTPYRPINIKGDIVLPRL